VHSVSSWQVQQQCRRWVLHRRCLRAVLLLHKGRQVVFYLMFSGTCNDCSAGTAAPPGSASCAPCASGTYAPVSMTAHHFYGLPLPHTGHCPSSTAIGSFCLHRLMPVSRFCTAGSRILHHLSWGQVQRRQRGNLPDMHCRPVRWCRFWRLHAVSSGLVCCG
jgi:hypothetical protein